MKIYKKFRLLGLGARRPGRHELIITFVFPGAARAGGGAPWRLEPGTLEWLCCGRSIGGRARRRRSSPPAGVGKPFGSVDGREAPELYLFFADFASFPLDFGLTRLSPRRSFFEPPLCFPLVFVAALLLVEVI